MVAKTGAFSTSNGSFPNLLTIPCLFAPSVNSGTVASAPLVVNDGAKVPLVAGRVFIALYSKSSCSPFVAPLTGTKLGFGDLYI